MTLTELTYDFLNLYYAGRPSDDRTLSIRQIVSWINNYRAVILKQDLQKGRNINPTTLQNLGKVKIKKVDASECGCDVKGCSLYKIETVLPKVIDLNGSPLINYIGTVNGTSYQRTDYHSLQWLQYSKYTGKVNRWFYIGDELYIISPNSSLGRYVNIQGLFEDPVKANIYKTCECETEDSCNTGYDFEYPLPTTMWDTVKKLIMDSESRFRDSHVKDDTNDSREDEKNV